MQDSYSMAKYNCTYCQNLISSVRIKCTECADFDLCLQCFSCGAEAGTHKKEHDYQVLDDGTFNLFESTEDDWVANEETLLIDSVEQHGFGNWEDVSGHIENKSAEECKDHYYAFFIHGNIGKATFTEAGDGVNDHTTPEGGPLSPSLTTPLPSIELSLQEQHDLGYMPFRDDFEREYDNEAETIVSSLALNYDDEDIDLTFKLVQVDMYRQRLKERQRRKRIARGYGLITSVAEITNNIKKPKESNKKKSSKNGKELKDKMRVFAQFHTAVEHEQFFANIHKEKQIKTRIKELMRYRRNGITKLEECSHYEAERHRRERKKENKKKMAALAAAKRLSMALKKEKGEDEEDDFIGDKEDNAAKEMSGLPGYDLLSERERKLCHSIGMKPASYITIKTCIIKDYLQRRQGLPVKIRYPNHLDKTHRRKIMSFLSDNGWIGVV